MNSFHIKTMGCEDIIKVFFHMTLNIKLYHWQTKSFARHKASDELFGNLLASIDNFIEVYMGKYGRPKFDNTFQIMVNELSDIEFMNYINKYISFLTKEMTKSLATNDTDLYNIRDEILAHFHKTLYLITLE